MQVSGRFLHLDKSIERNRCHDSPTARAVHYPRSSDGSYLASCLLPADGGLHCGITGAWAYLLVGVRAPAVRRRALLRCDLQQGDLDGTAGCSRR
jgi:hypothetical protein